MHFEIKAGVWTIVAAYLVIMNLIAFSAMGIDKWKAKHQKWRIPEKTLFLWVFLGGSIGGIAGMKYFRHKTKHMAFKMGFPLIFIIQVASCLWILGR